MASLCHNGLSQDGQWTHYGVEYRNSLKNNLQLSRKAIYFTEYTHCFYWWSFCLSWPLSWDSLKTNNLQVFSEKNFFAIFCLFSEWSIHSFRVKYHVHICLLFLLSWQLWNMNVIQWNNHILSEVPLQHAPFSPKSSQYTPHNSGVFCEFIVWFMFSFSHSSDLCNIMLYWTALYRHLAVFANTGMSLTWQIINKQRFCTNYQNRHFSYMVLRL